MVQVATDHLEPALIHSLLLSTTMHNVSCLVDVCFREFWCGPPVIDWWEAWQQGDEVRNCPVVPDWHVCIAAGCIWACSTLCKQLLHDPAQPVVAVSCAWAEQVRLL